MAWTEFKTRDKGQPGARECHSMVAVGQVLYLFGGNDRTQRFNDLRGFDTVTHRWTPIAPAEDSQVPCVRTAHAATSYEKFLIVFGGWNGERELDDVFSFDTETHQWRELKGTGPAPSGRHFPAVTVVRRNLIVFGGFDGSDWCNDVHVLNLETLVWTRPDLGGAKPTPRASATAVTVPGDRVIVFGGFDGSAGAAEGGTSRDFRDDVWILHTVDETGTEAFAWESCPRPSGRRSRETCWPKPRSGHSCSVLGSQMFVFGGRSSEGRFRDTHALNTDTMTWSLVETMGQAPCARKTHAMARAGDRIFVVGGHDGTAAGWLDDFFILHVGGVGRAGAGSLGLLAEFVPASSSAARTDGGSSLRHDLAELLDLDLEGDLLSPPAPLDGTSDVFGSPPQNAKQAAEPSTPGMAAPAPAAAASASASSRSAGAGGPRSWGGDDDDRVARGAPSPSIPGLRAGFVASLPERRSFDQDWGSKTRLGDVTFIVQGRRVVLHKCVLAARSEYYRHMFLSDMAEASDAHPVIPLVDVPIPIFLALVRYIYTDRLPPRPVRDRLVPGLLQQAQKLGMVRLSVLCQQHLASRLSVHNAIAMLDAADTHGAIPLRRAAFVFVLDNFAAVSKTLPFLQLRGDLLRHIMWRRARRRSKPEDRRTLTWQAVEDGLDDVDKAQEIVFPVTDEEAEASNVDQAAGAAGEASAADGGKGSTPGLMSSSSSSAASTHVPIGPSAATKRLSSLLRPGSGSQSAATAFAAVLEGASSISRAAKRPSDGEDSESKRSHHSETSCSRSADGHGASSRARMALSEAEDPDHADSEHAEDSDASSQASPTHEELRGRRTSRGSGGVRGHGNDGSNDSTDGPSLMDEAPRAAMGAGAGQAPSSASSEASRSRRQ